jgi:sugar (pentulose or hexulose) kinase
MHSTQEYAVLFPSQVVAPSAPVAAITAAAASRTGLPASCLVCGGTTDSIAAFVAAGVSDVGGAVTSLGSTMAVKLLSETRVDDAAYGVYSHRLGECILNSELRMQLRKLHIYQAAIDVLLCAKYIFTFLL